LDKGFFDYFKGKRRIALIVLAVALGLFLLMLPASDGVEGAASPDSLDEYRERLEAEVASLASDVKGVGKCRVLITFERGGQYTYKNGELTESRPPLVLGVTVVCSGGDSDHVRARLTEMITALFDIPSNRVAVLKSG
jgi:stage III sporulation protein AG